MYIQTGQLSPSHYKMKLFILYSRTLAEVYLGVKVILGKMADKLEMVGGGWLIDYEANSHYFVMIEYIMKGLFVRLWSHKVVVEQ